MVQQVDITHKICKYNIIWSNKPTKSLHIKYNGKMILCEVPEIKTVKKIRVFKILKHLGILLYKILKFDAFAITLSLQI